MSDSETPLELQTVFAIEQIVEEAADKRWPLDSETVEEAMELVTELQSSDTPMPDEVLVETQEDLERLHHLVDGAPRRSVDHTSVQNIVDTFAREAIDAGVDL